MDKDNRNNEQNKEIKESKKSLLGKLFSFKNRKYIVSTILGVMVLALTLTYATSSPTIVKKSYAAGDGYTWDGYYTDTDNIHTQDLGYNAGYFYINLYKGTTRFISALFKVTRTTSGGTSGSNALYNTIMGNSQAYSFDYADKGYGSYKDWIKVGASASTSYGTRKTGIVDVDSNGHYEYAAPTISIKIPAGYHYSLRTNGYDTTRFNKPTALAAIYCSSSPYQDGNTTGFDKSKCYTQTTDNKYVKMLYADNPSINNSASMEFSSQASHRWTTGGRLQINVPKSTGLCTRQGEKSGLTSKYYRARQSYSVRFVPNTTTVNYDANGGSGAPGSQTKTYDTELTLSSTKPTRSGYTFVNWCTGQSGTGTCFGSGGKVQPQIWPVAQSVKLFAQWREAGQTAGEWCGYSTTSIAPQTQVTGWQNGYGYVHLGKCDIDENNFLDCTKYSTNEFKSIMSYATGSGSNAHWVHQRANSISSTFSIIKGDTNNFDIVTATTSTAKKSLNGNTEPSGYYVYFNGPTVKVKAPKGYKYWTYMSPYPTDLWTGNAEFTLRANQTVSNTAAPELLEQNPGPYATDTWLTGKLALNTASIGHKTLTNYNFRVYKALCLAFKPNSRTFSYNANGGTGTVANTRYVYGDSDEEPGMIIADNGFTRTGYEFTGWNTAADGSGTSYEEGQTIPENTWPADETSQTLYAQWIPKYTATFYYNSSAEEGEININTTTAECTVTSGTSCTINIPDEVLDSVGQYNNSYAGLATTTGTMTASGASASTEVLTLSSNITRYAVYSEPVDNYYYNP